MRKGREDFSAAVKRLAAARVGHLCSNPECRAPTSGPEIGGKKAISLGVAAHITAAAPQGPRFDPNLPPLQRADISNAIWLCQTCARRIDVDENAYSAEQLRVWKEDAENRASTEAGKHRTDITVNMAAHPSSPDAFLDQVVESFSAEAHGGALYLVARPSRKTEDLLRKISHDYIRDTLSTAASNGIFPRDFSPSFVPGQIRNHTRGRLIHMGNRHKLNLEVGYDGDMQLFCSRAVEGKQILDYGVAETTVRFLYFVGLLYQEAQYFATCDLGVAITGLLGAESARARVRWDLGIGNAFEEPSYRRTIQAATRSMVEEPKMQANRLLERFFNVLGERLNPLV